MLTAKPVDHAAPAASVAELWTKDAVPVDKATLSLARVPATQPAAPDAAARAQAAPQPAATVVAAATPTQEEQARLPAAHVSWCANRYRSYSPEDNSYISYSGQQRPCVSPYLNANNDMVDDTGDEAAVQTATQVGYVETGDMASGTNLSSASAGHIESCFGRYRSYRPEDNTYQPFSGGPRRQCE
jgi:hypothetical protein